MTRLRPAKSQPQKSQRFWQFLQRSWRIWMATYNQSPHHSFRKTIRVRNPGQLRRGTKEAWRLLVETTLFIKEHYGFFLWMIVLYGLITFFLVGGISQIDYVNLKKNATNLSNGLDAVSQALAYLGAALTGGISSTPTTLQQVLAGITILFFWLAIIWGVRMMMAGKKIRVRDAFYNGMTPLIPTILLLVIITLQLIPAALTLFGITVAVNYYWITNWAEGLAFGGVTALACLLSLYWVSGSIVALAVVALPGTYPVHALADTRSLVMGRRWEILMRVMILLIIETIAWVFILVPAFMLDRWLNLSWLPIVPVAFQLIAGFSVMFTSVYIYKLYRSLL